MGLLKSLPVRETREGEGRGRGRRRTRTRKKSLRLRRLRKFLISPSLHSLRRILSIKTIIPPSKAARKVPDEFLMVDVMVIRAGPDGEEMMQTPGEVIAAMRIDGLEQTHGDPDVHSEDVQIAGDGAPEDGRADGADA